MNVARRIRTVKPASKWQLHARWAKDHEKIANKASAIDCFDFSGAVGIRLQ
jgi:hypothetical protein